MSESTKLPNIFLSYCWKDTKYADEIDSDFKAVGITFLRDVRDARYRNSIKDFMNRIGKTDFVVMLISNDYLRSANCMYEVSELLNSHEFEKRILPVALESANGIFKATNRIPYYDYWKNELKIAKANVKKHTNQDFLDEEKKLTNINNHLDIYFQKVTDLNINSFEDLKKKNYKPMLDIIGIDEDNILDKVLKIEKMQDGEDRELELDIMYAEHPENQYVLFLKATLFYHLKYYKRAAYFIHEVLRVNPFNSQAHYNLALLAHVQFNNNDLAKKHYEEAIRISPNYLNAYYNLALLLHKHFKDYINAKKYYEVVLLMEPEKQSAYNNLGLLLENNFKDYGGAKINYELEILFHPKSTEARNNIANLLSIHFKEYDKAKEYFEEAIEINPDEADLYYNFSILLDIHFLDKKKSKELYIKATDLNTELISSEGDGYYKIIR